jgi:hypothetical protein
MTVAMTEAAIAPLERAQKLAGAAATVAVISAIMIVLAAVGRDIAVPAAEVLRSQEVTPDWRGALNLFNAVGSFVVLALPSFMLAGALLELSKVLDEYGKGHFFTLKASAGVRKAAESALWAMAFKVLISPTIFNWITQSDDIRGFVWRLEPFDLGLIAFAAFVMVLGRVLEAAARIKAENDQIV